MEKNQLNISTNTAVGNDLRKNVHEFTQQFRGISKNLQVLTLETVELHAVENVDSNLTDLHKDQMENLAFEIYDPCGIFPKLEHDISLISNNLESIGRISCNGNYFSHEKESDEWFQDHKATVCIFVDAVSLLHAIGGTVVHTFEATRTREAAKKIDLDSDI